MKFCFSPLLVAGCAILVLTGCATVTRGTTGDVQFTSEPSGALASTSLGSSCTTPCTLKFSRKDEFTVTFKLEGYEEQAVPVTAQVGGAGAAGLAGNVLIGGVVGMVADAASGATLEHSPNPVSVVLKKLAPPPRSAPPRNAPRRPVRPAAPKVSQLMSPIH